MTLDVATGGESGLLGLALHPKFYENRFVYVAYSYRTGMFAMRNRLVRLREDVNTAKGVLDKVLLDDVAGAHNHDGGRVKFGPDGKLYSTTGDAQKSDAAQQLTSLNGKILRFNPDGGIPADNRWPTPIFTPTAIATRRDSLGNRSVVDFTPSNMDQAVFRVAAQMK